MTVWDHLEARPHLWRRQLWLRGTRARASDAAREVEQGTAPEAVAIRLGVPIAAIEEARRYTVEDAALITAEQAEDDRLAAAERSGGLHRECVLEPRAPLAEWGVVGLGNPAERYAHTRHNLGWDVVALLAERWGLAFEDAGEHARHARGAVTRTRVVLAQPLTYMNDSGRAAHALLHALALPVERVLVVYDDAALSLGTLRLRERGSAGSHNGMHSVVAHLGEAFPRLRLGIAPATRPADLYEFVLSPFDASERSAVDAMVALAADAIGTIVSSGVSAGMALVNARP